VKVLEKRKGADEFVHAQHILVQDNDSAKALADAKALLARAKAGEDFGALAAEHSTEPGADTRKGDLGWFKRGRMVKEFEEAVFKAKPGTIIGPVKTQFGQHVIKIHAKDNAEVKVRDIRIPIEMSARTQGDVRSRAEDFAFLAREEGFEKEAGTAKLEILETRAFEENQGIPGIGMNRGISRFAFSGEAGDVSDAISVSNGVAVFTISEVKDAGVKSVDEVKDALRRVLIRENLFAKAKAIADERFAAWKPADSMSVLANGMSGVLVEATAGFRLDASIPRIGRDPAVSGVLDRMNQGEVSKPFVGGRGVYIIRIASKTSFDSTTYSVQRASLMQELLETKKSNFFSTWSASLMDHAEIVDNRDLFYR
jgi:parvulin-like peptidyl-prolyl isomerase